MNLQEAIKYLESHVNLEAMLYGRREAPTLERIEELCRLMGDPQLAYPVIHVTGTNGKGSTVRVATSLLNARGLSVGGYTSPDLERVNERIARDGEPIPDADLAEVLSALADLEDLMGAKPHRFDLLTAAAFRWFADEAVEAAVIEVGLGGTWDATNVVQPEVAVITNIELDHVEVLGPTRADIAADKAGIVKAGSILVLGETDPELAPIFSAAAERVGAEGVWRRGEDFEVVENSVAVGGRVISLRTPGAVYEDLFLPLHGAYQATNAACAVAAVEAFFGQPASEEVVAAGLAAVRCPGRLEVVGRQPLVVLDGAHNPAGARAAAAALDEEFSEAGGRILVVGLLKGRSPEEMLESLGARKAGRVIATAPATPRALPAEQVAAAARDMGLAVEVVDDVAAAVARAREVAEPTDLVLVSGSLYVVGAARSALVSESA
ncbi:MAG: bifunctional folylpolyglutamate synthase/dihydrofolate synthase [Acidimicrobiales bacterium]